MHMSSVDVTNGLGQRELEGDKVASSYLSGLYSEHKQEIGQRIMLLLVTSLER